jgi:hypothetical protein
LRPESAATLVAGLALVLAPEAHCLAQPSQANEASVKAAFIYNFGKFTEWPAEPWSKAAKLRLCLAGPVNELSRAVEALQGKPPVQGKALEVVSISRPADAGTCHMLVVTAQDRVGSDWIRAAAAGPVMTVGDAEGFAAAGGIVGLYVDGEKVRFEINADAAQRANLHLSSQLLKLARIVKGAPAAKP